MKRAQYAVKQIDHPLLGWAIYQVTPVEGHEPVKNLVALAIDERTAQRIAALLSGDDDQVEGDGAEHEAADAALWAWRMGTG